MVGGPDMSPSHSRSVGKCMATALRPMIPGTTNAIRIPKTRVLYLSDMSTFYDYTLGDGKTVCSKGNADQAVVFVQLRI